MQYRSAARPLPPRSSICLTILTVLPLAAPVRADDAKAHFDKAVALYAKKPDAALEEFALAQKEAPNDADILSWIGFIQSPIAALPGRAAAAGKGRATRARTRRTRISTWGMSMKG